MLVWRTLLSEGDEDALIISQFEEALVDSLQNDPEVATCLNSYVEARKKGHRKGESPWVLRK